jgi:hypothetical protein
MGKSTKCPHKIIAHSLVKYMAAMPGRALAPMFLYTRQYGGINLERAYCIMDPLIDLVPRLESLASGVQKSYATLDVHNFE